MARKLMVMHEALHSRDIDRLYVSRKEGRRIASIEDCVDAAIQGFADYIKKSKERLITAVSNNCDNIRTNRKKTKTWKQKWVKNNCMGILSDKLEILHTRRPGNG